MKPTNDFLEAYSLSKICKIVLEYTLKCSQLISSSDNKKILLTTRNVRLDSGRYATKYYFMNFFTTYGGSTIFMPSLWMHHNIHYTKNSWQNHTVWEQINNFRAHFTFGKRLLKNNLQFFSIIQSPVKSSAKSSYCSSARAFCLVTYLNTVFPWIVSAETIVWIKTNNNNKMVILRLILAVFPPPVCLSFTKPRFRRSFRGA